MLQQFNYVFIYAEILMIKYIQTVSLGLFKLNDSIVSAIK